MICVSDRKCLAKHSNTSVLLLDAHGQDRMNKQKYSLTIMVLRHHGEEPIGTCQRTKSSLYLFRTAKMKLLALMMSFLQGSGSTFCVGVSR